MEYKDNTYEAFTLQEIREIEVEFSLSSYHDVEIEYPECIAVPISEFKTLTDEHGKDLDRADLEDFFHTEDVFEDIVDQGAEFGPWRNGCMYPESASVDAVNMQVDGFDDNFVYCTLIIQHDIGM